MKTSHILIGGALGAVALLLLTKTSEAQPPASALPRQAPSPTSPPIVFEVKPGDRVWVSVEKIPNLLNQLLSQPGGRDANRQLFDSLAVHPFWIVSVTGLDLLNLSGKIIGMNNPDTMFSNPILLDRVDQASYDPISFPRTAVSGIPF
jgi:hypothetical protein